MSKTINYELAKKLYDVGVEIESEYIYIYELYKKEEWTLEKRSEFEVLNPIIPAPNCEEVIEFLESIEIDNFHLSVEFYSGLTIINYRSSGSILFPCIEEPTLLEALESTLEYLLDNWYIWTKEKK